MANTVFVLGGGRTGLVAVRDLIQSNVVDHVIIGDIETSKAEKLAKELGSTKIDVVKVDLSNQKDLVKAIRDSQVLINATWYEYNIEVMKAAIEARAHYTDLGGLFHVTRRQLELDEAARQAGITAVLGSGESPGITNIMCASSAEEMDAVQEIRIRVGAREMSTSKSDKLVFPFAVSTIFDEYSKTPVMYVNGQFQEVAPLSGDEEVEFPAPVGRNVCHYSIHSEIATLPLNIKGVKHVDFKLGVSERLYKAVKPLVDAGLADTTPIEVKGAKISPREYAIAYLSARASDEEPVRYVALRTEVTGLKDGKRIRQVCEVVGEPSEKIGVRNATALLTGIGASITAQLMLKAQISRRGVVAPESCIPTSVFISELEKRKIRITKKES